MRAQAQTRKVPGDMVMLLGILGGLALVGGGAALMHASSVDQQIVAMLALLIGTVWLSSAAIVEAVSKRPLKQPPSEDAS